MKSIAILQLGLGSAWDSLILAQAWNDPSFAALIKGTIAQESEWDITAENPNDPSAGLMQIMYGPKGPYPGTSRDQLMVPATNIVLGSQYLRRMVNRFGVTNGVSAYNGGYRNSTVTNWPYVHAVLDNQRWYLDNDPLLAPSSPSYPYADTPPIGDPESDPGTDSIPPALEIGGGAMLALAVIIGFYLWKK